MSSLVRLKKLSLSRFRGFRDYMVDVDPFTVLAGRNNSGKTSVLLAARLLHDALRAALGGQDGPTFVNPWPRHVQVRDLSQKLSLTPELIWFSRIQDSNFKVAGEYILQQAGGPQPVLVALTVFDPAHFKVDLSIAGEAPTEDTNDVLSTLFHQRTIYLPPPGTLPTIQEYQGFPEIQQRLFKGEHGQTWRGQLYWSFDPNDRQGWELAAERVQTYIPGVRMRAPSLSKTSPSRFLVEFEEEGTVYDISASGTGLITLLSVVAASIAGDTSILLIDEPDAHLHSTLQRQIARLLLDIVDSGDAQVIVASHAPDFLDEAPVGAIRWIDRHETKARPVDDAGRLLVSLGALTSSQASRAMGIRALVYTENTLDRRILAALAARSGYGDLFDQPGVLVLPLQGHGDAQHLASFKRLFRNVQKVDLAVCAILDADYRALDVQADPVLHSEDGVHILRLPVKEVENLLLVSPTLTAAISRQLEERKRTTGEAISPPSEDDVTLILNEQSGAKELRESLQHQWQALRIEDLVASDDPDERRMVPAARHERASREFEERWKDPAWRLRSVSGKRLLAMFRGWARAKFKVNVSDKAIVDSLASPPEALARVFEIVRAALTT